MIPQKLFGFQRRDETRAVDGLVNQNPILIAGPLGMGRQSFGKRLAHGFVKQKDLRLAFKTIELDLDDLKEQPHGGENAYFYDLGQQLSDKASVSSNRFDTFWQKDLAFPYRLTEYMEAVILKQEDRPLLLKVKNFQSLFSNAIPHRGPSMFQYMLKDWVDKAQSDHAGIWQRLHLLLLHQGSLPWVFNRPQNTLYRLNYLIKILIEEWNSSQIKEFLEYYELSLNDDAFTELVEYIGGYPLLLNLARTHMQDKNISLIQSIRQPLSQGPFARHLTYIKKQVDALDLWDCIQKMQQNDFDFHKRNDLVGQDSLEALYGLGIICFSQEKKCWTFRNHLFKTAFEEWA